MERGLCACDSCERHGKEYDGQMQMDSWENGCSFFSILYFPSPLIMNLGHMERKKERRREREIERESD